MMFSQPVTILCLSLDFHRVIGKAVCLLRLFIGRSFQGVTAGQETIGSRTTAREGHS